MARIPWSENEESILRQMVAKQISLEDMGRVLKSRTQAAIINKLGNMGLKRSDYAQQPVIDFDALRILNG